jgi:hypothetical protein
MNVVATGYPGFSGKLGVEWEETDRTMIEWSREHLSGPREISAGFFFDRGRSFALAVTQVIELGPADGTAALDFHLGYAWAVQRENPFHTFAIGHAADGEIRIQSRAFAANHDPGINLDALFVTFDDPGVYADGVPDLKGWGFFFKLFGFDFFEQVHRSKWRKG